MQSTPVSGRAINTRFWTCLDQWWHLASMQGGHDQCSDITFATDNIRQLKDLLNGELFDEDTVLKPQDFEDVMILKKVRCPTHYIVRDNMLLYVTIIIICFYHLVTWPAFSATTNSLPLHDEACSRSKAFISRCICVTHKSSLIRDIATYGVQFARAWLR